MSSLRNSTLRRSASRIETRLEPALQTGAAARTLANRPEVQLSRQPLRAGQASLAALVVGAAVALTLLWGFSERDSWGLTPGRGTGYWIGIIGAVCILMTLAYPLRKYWRPMSGLGTVAGWFKVHMLLGIFGPAVILFHSNFRLGALNSNVALIAMLCVAGSGIVGRYLYGNLHYGLHGRRAELGEMVSDAAEMRRTLGADLPQNSPIWAELKRLEAIACEPSRGLGGALLRSLSLGSRTSAVRKTTARGARRFIDAECKRRNLTRRQRRDWNRVAQMHLDVYFRTVAGTARLILFERLFALWHLLHVPIFVIMLLSAVVHIVAVHFY